MGQKNNKGSVSIFNDNGRIRLRWRYKKKRYSINLFALTRENRKSAKRIALQIEYDLFNNIFDTSLNKYNVRTSQASINEPHHKTLPEHFRDWTTNYRNKSCDQHIDYYATHRMMLRWGQFCSSDVLSHFNSERLSARTYNRRLQMLKSFFEWTTKKKITESNPLEDVLRKKVITTKKPERRPFTEAEISNILTAFKNDTFVPVSSRFKHSFYYPFIYFIFKFGVRNSEAIGLRVQNVNIQEKIVLIKEVLARNLTCSNSGARIRKETKNGKERMLPLDDDTLNVIADLLKEKKPDDLVFQSPSGQAIDDKAFQKRVFTKVLAGLKIEKRVLYACRHTFGSRCINAGLTPVMTSFLMGNNPETALRNYVHLMELPKKLPQL
jgi:integrase